MKHRGWGLVGALALTSLVVGGDASAAAQKKRSGAGLGKHETFPKAQSSARAVKPGTGVSAVGTLNYDNDIPSKRDGTLNVPIGNVFNVGFIDPHSIAAISFRVAGCFQTPVPQFQLRVLDVNTAGMTQMGLIPNFTGGGNCSSGATSGGILRTAMLPTAVVGHSGPFIAALLNTPYAGCNGMTGIGGTCEGVALSQGAVDPGMGFHAVRVAGSMSTAPNLGSTNAIMRATGDNLPVELMNFGVN